MDTFLNCCTICLKRTDALTKACDSEVSIKLQTVIPELEVLEDVSICQDCLDKLHEFVRFRTQCLDALTRWKNRAVQGEDLIDALPEHTNLLENHTEERSAFDEPTIKYYTSHRHEESTDIVDNLSNDLFSCEFCKNFYLTKKNLHAHQKYCKQQNLHTTQTTSNKKLKRHQVYHISCEVCNKQFTSVEDIQVHYSSEHDSSKDLKPYVCVTCNNRFPSLPLLQEHLKCHHRSKVCTICGKSFTTRNDLMVHEYTHYNRRNYVCKDCGNSFNTNKNLRTHILVVHTDRSLWKYHCASCDKRFPLKSNYDQHCRRHNGEKTYACHICDKCFVSNSDLKRHVRLHSNIKRYKCASCDKEYKTQSSYKIHVDRKHSKTGAPVKEKKFACHICPSRFCDKSKLTRHLCTHSGLRPFKCDMCGKQFADKSYLRQHLKGVHHVVNEK